MSRACSHHGSGHDDDLIMSHDHHHMYDCVYMSDYILSISRPSFCLLNSSNLTAIVIQKDQIKDLVPVYSWLVNDPVNSVDLILAPDGGLHGSISGCFF